MVTVQCIMFTNYLGVVGKCCTVDHFRYARLLVKVNENINLGHDDLFSLLFTVFPGRLVVVAVYYLAIPFP